MGNSINCIEHLYIQYKLDLMLSTCSTALNFIYPCFLGPFVGCQMHLPHPLAPLSRTLPSASCHVAFFHFALTIKHHLLAYIIHVFYYFTQLLSTHLWSGKRTRGSLGSTSFVSMYLSILFSLFCLGQRKKMNRRKPWNGNFSPFCLYSSCNMWETHVNKFNL